MSFVIEDKLETIQREKEDPLTTRGRPTLSDNQYDPGI